MQFQFDSIADFMEMAGHGPYVWACYAITAVSMIYLAVVPLRRRKALFKEIKQQQRRAQYEQGDSLQTFE